MVRIRDIEFAAEGGVRLRGWLFSPEGRGPRPAITMAHGYAGVKEHGLEVKRKSKEDGPVEATITNTILVPTAFSKVR